MGLFSKKNLGGGIMDAIRCDESSYLIWKWHPEGTSEGQNRKENAIRFGSSLRVKQGSVAVFVYNQQNGIYQDYIEGPADVILETNNLPVLSGILGLAYGGDTPFQAEVYFVNLAEIIQVRFGVPFFDVFDPRFLDFAVPTAVRGTISFKISDYMAFTKLHRLETFSLADFYNQVRDAICRYVKEVVSNAPESYGIPVMQLERKIGQINSIVEEKIQERFFSEFGVTVSSIDIAAIEIDKESEGYKELKKVTKDTTTAQVQAQSDVSIRAMRDNQRINSLEKVGRVAMNVFEDGFERHMRTQKGDFPAFQTEPKELKGVKASQGFVTDSVTGSPNMVPPPIPTPLYHVAVNGQANGPYDIMGLKKMASNGELTVDSLVWTQGMSSWEKAGNIKELASVFCGMPPIPTE